MSNFTEKMLSIQQVSLITGLSKPVIRKWEDRYHTVTPKRLHNGRRVYTDRDVQILLTVRKLVDEGLTIQQATAQAHYETPQLSTIESCAPTIHNEYCLRLLEYGSTCDVIGIKRVLQEAHHKLGIERFLDEVVVPLMFEIGVRWEKERWNPFQESVSSTVIRDYLVGLRNDMHMPDDAPLLIGACLPGESHDLPLCILLLQAQMHGYRVYLISSSPAPGAIEQLIIYFNPKVVLLSAMSELPFTTYPDVLPALDVFAADHSEVHMFIGGSGTKEYLKTHTLHTIRYINDLQDILNEVEI
ncbi:MerR family transcriptional regulator [Lysinibacillus sp. LZ02]|uniref:MerR family transcriptional regulator n=1 Tax=Lysinibacillus sp. LZ02 TaxID=3420668 RepID=UPI003D363CB1